MKLLYTENTKQIEKLGTTLSQHKEAPRSKMETLGRESLMHVSGAASCFSYNCAPASRLDEIISS